MWSSWRRTRQLVGLQGHGEGEAVLQGEIQEDAMLTLSYSQPLLDTWARLPEVASCLLRNTAFNCSPALEFSPTVIFILLLGSVIRSITT